MPLNRIRVSGRSVRCTVKGGPTIGDPRTAQQFHDAETLSDPGSGIAATAAVVNTARQPTARQRKSCRWNSGRERGVQLRTSRIEYGG